VNATQNLSDSLHFEWSAEPLRQRLSVYSRKGCRSERAGILVLDSSNYIFEEFAGFFIDQAEMSEIGSFMDDFTVFVQDDAVDADRSDVNPNIIIHKFDPSINQHSSARSRQAGKTSANIISPFT
jgi:hypothetical protein